MSFSDPFADPTSGYGMHHHHGLAGAGGYGAGASHASYNSTSPSSYYGGNAAYGGGIGIGASSSSLQQQQQGAASVLREEYVSNAVRFLQHPNVAKASAPKRIQFLEKKVGFRWLRSTDRPIRQSTDQDRIYCSRPISLARSLCKHSCVRRFALVAARSSFSLFDVIDAGRRMRRNRGGAASRDACRARNLARRARSLERCALSLSPLWHSFGMPSSICLVAFVSSS
jgi:hypothetical protein